MISTKYSKYTRKDLLEKKIKRAYKDLGYHRYMPYAGFKKLYLNRSQIPKIDNKS